MSGHSKWSTIKHKKALVDAKKGKVFSKLARLVAVESKLAQGDVSSPSLKAVIQKAKAANMPKDNIERAVAKGVGGGGGEECVLYELYGPGGVAVLVNTLTNNRNRTVTEIKMVISKLGYQLAEPGAAVWAFKKDGADWKANTTVMLDDELVEKLSSLVDSLEELEDVEGVYTNAE